MTAQLASRIVFQYDTNEVGQIAEIGEDGIGAVRPGVEVEVVDQRDAAVPAGRIGEIRVRAPHRVERYAGNLGRMHFFAVQRIPRTRETGKIRRAELKRMLAPK